MRFAIVCTLAVSALAARPSIGRDELQKIEEMVAQKVEAAKANVGMLQEDSAECTAAQDAFMNSAAVQAANSADCSGAIRNASISDDFDSACSNYEATCGDLDGVLEICGAVLRECIPPSDPAAIRDSPFFQALALLGTVALAELGCIEVDGERCFQTFLEGDYAAFLLDIAPCSGASLAGQACTAECVTDVTDGFADLNCCFSAIYIQSFAIGQAILGPEIELVFEPQVCGVNFPTCPAVNTILAEAGITFGSRGNGAAVAQPLAALALTAAAVVVALLK